MRSHAAIAQCLSILAALLCLAAPAPAEESPDAYVEYTRARIQKAEAARQEKDAARQERLERLEDWKKSGLIDEKEYEELRKKYLGK